MSDGMRERIGFIGLGVMGRPMAENLLAKGYALTVHSRSPGPVDELVSRGAGRAASPAEAASAADVVVTMLPDTPDVEAVYFGENGVMSAFGRGQLAIDMSTVTPAMAERINARARELGGDSLDAPVSGGDVGAREGTLSIMAGGSAAAWERAGPVFACMGRTVVHVGGPGAGQLVKACNQIVVGLTIAAVGEAFALAQKGGVSPAVVREVLLGGFAQSRVLDAHGLRALEGRFAPGFRLRLHRKDLRIALDAAERLDASLGHTALLHETMNALVARGWGERDHAALIAHAAELAEAARE